MYDPPPNYRVEVIRIPVPPEGCTCIHPTHHRQNRSYSLTRCNTAPLWTTNKAHRIASASFSRNVNDAMKDVGAGRRRRISRRLIGHWPHIGRAQQQDSSWKPLGAAEGTKGGCRRAWTACGRSWRGRDRARCRAPCNVSFVTSKRNNSTTRCVQNTLDPVFDVESDGELGSDSKLRRNGYIGNR